MSEEILKSIIELLAIVACEDEVTSDEKETIQNFLNENLSRDNSERYMAYFENLVNNPTNESEEESIDRICRQINQSLTSQQKVIILLNLLELIVADSRVSERENYLLNLIIEGINIKTETAEVIKNFIIYPVCTRVITDHLLLVDNGKSRAPDTCKRIIISDYEGLFFVLRIPDYEFYFCKYVGESIPLLNGAIMRKNKVYVFPLGAIVKSKDHSPIFYSEAMGKLRNAAEGERLTFTCEDVDFKFKNGDTGLRNIHIAEDGGKLIALMGGSGAGKSTLLNVLNGNLIPSSGKVSINGIDIHKSQSDIEGVIGYIPQDDLLIEELTVFENLYYAARLCFSNKSVAEIRELVDKTIESLGLSKAKNLKVGSPLDKSISGGQRKRLNIGLELIREPNVLFVDEPTSGLSSRDSENIMDLLKELSLKGKMIFVVIHQPSEDIYKMFDKLILLDVGGYQIYYGNPVEAINYFNEQAKVVVSRENANPEQIFNIIEAKIINEYGNFTNQRKVQPDEWAERYEANKTSLTIPTPADLPPKTMQIPNPFGQLSIFIQRDVLSKISNRQYLLINFLEAPFLAFLLTYIIRYIPPTTEIYIFKENQNIPVFFFMSVIVSLFMGLTVSAEEIIRDRKILKREAFLHLSKGSYLSSKVIILFSISAIQTVTFVILSSWILQIKGMTFPLWLVLFSVSCFANILGLNVSAAFKSAVTVYILIPLLIIPQLILSGVVVSFDKLNPTISVEDKVPVIGEIMASRWAYEALAVTQFKDNAYMRKIFPFEQTIAQAEYKTIYLIPRLKTILDQIDMEYKSGTFMQSVEVPARLQTIRNMIEIELMKIGRDKFPEMEQLYINTYNAETFAVTSEFLDKLKAYYNLRTRKATENKDNVIKSLAEQLGSTQVVMAYRNAHENESIGQLTKNIAESNRIIQTNNWLIQKIYPVFQEKEAPKHAFDFRTQFYAPSKYFGGIYIDTLIFNIFIIWFMSILLFVTLYFDVLRKVINGNNQEF